VLIYWYLWRKRKARDTASVDAWNDYQRVPGALRVGAVLSGVYTHQPESHLGHEQCPVCGGADSRRWNRLVDFPEDTSFKTREQIALCIFPTADEERGHPALSKPDVSLRNRVMHQPNARHICLLEVKSRHPEFLLPLSTR